jgi:hypothetical protein
MRTHIPIRVALAAGVAATMAGCAIPASELSTPDTSPAATASAGSTAPPPVAPPPAGLGGVSAAEVCERFAAALHSADAADGRPDAAAIRAAAYATAALAGELVATAREPRWPALTKHQARLHPSVSAHVEAEQPPDSSTTAYRAVRVTTTAAGADGWRSGPDTTLVYCVLRREAGAWRVGGFDVAAVA